MPANQTVNTADGADDSAVRKTNRSTERSLTAIHDAYADLLAVKPIDKITVTDVARRAGVTRSTFYAYFSSIDDLRQSQFTRARRLVDVIHAHGVVFDLTNTDEIIAAVVNYVYATHDEYSQFINRYKDSPNARAILMTVVRDVYELLVNDVASSGRIVTERDKRCLSYTILVGLTLTYQYDVGDLDVPRETFRDAYQAIVRSYCDLMGANRITPTDIDPTALLVGDIWPGMTAVDGGFGEENITELHSAANES